MQTSFKLNDERCKNSAFDFVWPETREAEH